MYIQLQNVGKLIFTYELNIAKINLKRRENNETQWYYNDSNNKNTNKKPTTFD